MHFHDHLGRDKADVAGDEALYGRRVTVLKTASYAVMHLVVAIGVAYALTGNWRVALAIGLIEPAVQTVAYFFHDRGWNRYLAQRARRKAAPVEG